jgi:hypothetical protein
MHSHPSMVTWAKLYLRNVGLINIYYLKKGTYSRNLLHCGCEGVATEAMGTVGRL